MLMKPARLSQYMYSDWVTNWTTGESGFDSRRRWIFSFSQPCLNRLWGSCGPLSYRYWSYFTVTTWPGRDADHWPRHSVKVKNTWSCTSIRSYLHDIVITDKHAWLQVVTRFLFWDKMVLICQWGVEPVGET
jgi:hypothetical protein